MTDAARPRRRMVIYARISDDREGRQNGVDRQERQCRDLAAKNGDDIVAVFVDDDRSAYSGKPRPDYLNMLAYLEAGQADGAYALAPTRFYRLLGDGLAFFKLIIERRLEVETVKQGRYNLATADGRRDALRAAVDAQHEAEQISERVRDAKSDNVARGEYRGGPRPYGYEADGITVREDEAHWVCYATQAIIGGESLRSIARTLADGGARTPGRRFRQPDGTKGEPVTREWTGEDLRKMLLRARNCGLLEVTVTDRDGTKRQEIAGKAVWPGLVSEEEWRACAAILRNPARRTTTGNGRKWLGSGLYRCHCGQTLRGSTTGVGGVKKALEDGKTHRPAYRCDTPRHVIRDAVSLDAYVERTVVARLSRPDAAELHLKPVRAVEPQVDLDAQMNLLRAKLDGFTEDYNEDRITRKQFLDGTAVTREKLNALTARMSGRGSSSVLATLPLGTPEMEAVWPGLHLDKRRTILEALCTVTVNRARRGRPPGWKPGVDKSYFDASTIEIDWKPPQ